MHRQSKKFRCQKGSTIYVIEEDSVGWYLMVYSEKNTPKSSSDFLFDSLEDAIFEAEDRFDVARDSWEEML